MMEGQRKKIANIHQGQLNKLEKRLMLLEQMTNHSDNSVEIKELRRDIKQVKQINQIKHLIGGKKPSKRRTCKKRKISTRYPFL